MAYLGELFTSGVLNASLQKRPKTILSTLGQNRHTQKASKAAVTTGEGEKRNCQSLSS